MIDPSVLYRVAAGKRLFVADRQIYDVFLSAFNLSERVRVVFDLVQASSKYWIIHNEYQFSDAELPINSKLLQSNAENEGDFIIDVFENLESPLMSDARLCVDITGFMRAHLMFLMYFLKAKGLKSFDLMYTEPSQYFRRADTTFSLDIYEVRQVCGLEGVHSVDMANDLLVIGVGYDHELISNVLANKSNAKLLQVLSLPSLSADMYQESVVRLQKVADAPFGVPDELLAHASANDPFVTYIVLGEALEQFSARHSYPSNLYLSPLSTKPQAVGFALYYIDRLAGSPASMIMPFTKRYSKETSKGVGRTWIYPIDWQ
jgi:hypothetical protein